MKKQVYLTIDDAPTKYFKDKVDYLYKRKIPAIIFCVGEQHQKYGRCGICHKKGFPYRQPFLRP